MLNPTKKELIRLAHQILAEEEMLNTQDLLDKTQHLYNKLVVLQYLEQQEPDKEFVAQEAPKVKENISQPTTTPPIEQEKEAINELFASVTDPVFVKKEEEVVETELPIPAAETVTEVESKKNLNDILGKGIQIGLNDRLAFIKNLFEDNSDDYHRVISQVQTFQSWEEVLNFIEQIIKPEYNHWQGKEAFETRFLKCLESSF